MKEKLVIFGASMRGLHAFNKLKNDYNIVAFVDNDLKKCGTKFEGIEVITTKSLIKMDNEIVIASSYCKEIENQLIEMGIHNFRIYPSSVEFVLNRLSESGIQLDKISALQTFGGIGIGMEQFYKDKVKSLDVWEFEKSYEEKLRENLPNANIKITDSFKEIRETKKNYNMILMDNPMGMFGEHCEHFDMFMECFKVMRDECVVILDVMPNLENIDEQYEFIKTPEYLLSRKLFYRAQNPLNISIEDMVATYKEIAKKNGFEIKWYFTEERSGDFIEYLVLNLKKT